MRGSWEKVPRFQKSRFTEPPEAAPEAAGGGRRRLSERPAGALRSAPERSGAERRRGTARGDLEREGPVRTRISCRVEKRDYRARTCHELRIRTAGACGAMWRPPSNRLRPAMMIEHRPHASIPRTN